MQLRPNILGILISLLWSLVYWAVRPFCY